MNYKIIAYQLDRWEDVIDVRLELVKQADGQDRWAIREKGFCLNRTGEWEYEPQPSSRGNDFYERCRWNSAEDAMRFWEESDSTSSFAHYRDRILAKGAQP